jgi:heat shock protein HslJ
MDARNVRTNMSSKFRMAGVVVALILAIAACGDSDTVQSSDGDAFSEALDGRQFWSTRVVEGSVDRPLVEGTRIQLRFDDGSIGASAGCNSMGGPFEVEDGSALVVPELVMTEIGCDGPRHAQDEFVLALLSASPTITLVGDVLVLSTETTTVELLDREVADPDRPIIGTQWKVTGFIEGEVAMSMVVDEAGSVVFSDDSTMTGSDGCSPFAFSVEVSDGSIGGPVEGDGELQFGIKDPGSLDPADCGSEREYAEAFNELFATGDASYTIDGPNLTVLNGDGNGVTFRAVG